MAGYYSAGRRFVFSLSERRDDLSQWRGYAREGSGFTIGFDARALFDTADGGNGPFGFGKVNYQRAVATNAIRKAFLDIVDIVRKNAGPDQMKRATKEAARSFEWVVRGRGGLNKHASFMAEDE